MKILNWILIQIGLKTGNCPEHKMLPGSKNQAMKELLRLSQEGDHAKTAANKRVSDAG